MLCNRMLTSVVVVGLCVVFGVPGVEDVRGDTFRFTATADPRSQSARFDNVCAAINTYVGGPGVFHASPGDIDPLQPLRDIIDTRFGSSFVWYPMVGNHEEETAADMTWIRNEYNNGNGVRTPLKNFTNQDGPASSLETTYSWDYGNAHFISLNEYWNGSSDTGTDGDIVPALYSWLAADLAANTKPAIFVFGHEPAYPFIRHIGDSLDQYPANRDAFWALLEFYDVEAYICGHTHAYSRYQPHPQSTWQIDCGNAGNDSGVDTQTFVDVTVTDTQVQYDVWKSTVTGGTIFQLVESWSEPLGLKMRLSTASIGASTNIGTNPGDDTFTVQLVGGAGPMNYTISDDAAWMSVTPGSGSSTGEEDTITVQYSAASLPAGLYTGTITVSSGDVVNSPQTIAMTLIVVDPAGNLVVNGDFESGMTGWTPWAASWSNGETETVVYDAGLASNVMQLNCTGGASFMVYQQVTTVATHDYLVDAYWKGDQFDDDNWFEILLIDGPFSEYEADSGGAAVKANFMYAYDKPDNPALADFGWIWAHDQNNTPVDWNDRDGVRTASGTTMTVVLKAGANPFVSPPVYNVTAWFEDVSLIDLDAIPPAESDCSDGIDNDGDGLTDCCDTDCSSDAACGASEIVCTDGVDNDCDGLVDCCDSDCSGNAACGASEIGCEDGVDNDCDGLTDCQDVAACGSYDADGDGVCDSADRCPNDNPDDPDGDGVCQSVDNCPSTPNASQTNGDTDSLGDACDNCPLVDNENQANSDTDTHGDACDNCPTVDNENQANSDTDTHGDACDNCPTVDNETQANADGDAYGDACDACVNDPTNVDSDSDGICNDGDGSGTPGDNPCPNLVVDNCDDNCSGVANPTQAESDGDGVGDACDLCVGDDATGDCDFDGICDDTDPCPIPVLQTAVSRKTHTGAGSWDINVGAGDIECRSAQVFTANPNELTIVATFDIDIGLMGMGDEVVSTDVGTIASADQTNMREVTVVITDLPLHAQLNLAFFGVVDGWSLDPGSASPSTLCVRVIVGDYDNLGRTNFIDFAKVRNAGYINQLVNNVDKARADFDCGGRPTFLDFSKVKNAGLINQTAAACPSPPIGP